MNAPQRPSIRRWTLDGWTEPAVRIGVVLAEDTCPAAALRVGATPVALAVDAGAGYGAPRRLPPGTSLTVSSVGEALAVHVGDGPEQRGPRVRLTPAENVALAPGAGVLVHDVVAGRGFHWQRRIDQTLAGVVELRAAASGVVLVNELPLEEYLAGVITAEMSGACPLDLLRAQCVVARSWLLAMTEPKHQDDPFDRCNDDCCQRYQGTGDLSAAALAAVRDTRGEVLLNPAGQVLDANYAKICGGVSETPLAVWGLEKPGIVPIIDAPAGDAAAGFLPVADANLDEYLDGAWLANTQCFCSPNVVPVADIGRYLGRVDTVDDYFRWTVRYSAAELADLLRRWLSEPAELAALRGLHVRARGVSGRAYVVETEWSDPRGGVARRRLDSEYRIRQALHAKFLYSSAFAVREERDADGALRGVTLRGAGWGHGVGLCQVGALGMALRGYDYATICRHYYRDAQLERAYP